MHEQQGDCRRGHAGNPGRLAEGRRAGVGELAPHLVGQAVDRGVVERLGQGHALVAGEAGDLLGLSLDVTRVLRLDGHLLRDLRVVHRARGEGGDRRVIELRAPEQISKRILTLQLTAQLLFQLASPRRARMEEGRAQALLFALDRLPLGVEAGPAVIIDEPQLAAGRGEAQVRVVLPEQEPVLGAGGEHAIGLARPQGDEVVDQHAEVGLVAARTPGCFATHPAGRVDAGQQALGGRLLVTGGAVDLPGEEQPLDRPRLQRRPQVPGVEEVVFDRVARAGDHRVPEAGEGAHELELHVEGQAGGDAVRVELRRAETLGFDEHLVRVLVRKAVDLVLDARTVARTGALDHPRVHRRAIEVGTDDVVGARVGMGDPAAALLGVRRRVTEERHDRPRRVTPLLLEGSEVDAARVDARRRAGLEPVDAERQLAQAPGQGDRRGIAGTAAAGALEADVDPPAEEGPGGQHDGTSVEVEAHGRACTDDAVAVQQQVVHGLLEDLQARLRLQDAADGAAVQHAVGLGTGCANRRPLARVEHAELDPGAVRGRGHGTAEGIDLAHEVTLADTADGRVAGHLPERVDTVRQQQRTAAHACGRQARFGTGVATADHDHVKTVRVAHGSVPASLRAWKGAGLYGRVDIPPNPPPPYWKRE